MQGGCKLLGKIFQGAAYRWLEDHGYGSPVIMCYNISSYFSNIFSSSVFPLRNLYSSFFLISERRDLAKTFPILLDDFCGYL